MPPTRRGCADRNNGLTHDLLMGSCPMSAHKRENDTTGEPSDSPVGYKRPPTDTRFNPGRSGNPKGRPRGRPNAANVFQSAFNKPVPVRQGGRTRNMPTCEAIIRSLVGKAVQGDTRSLTAVMEIIEMTGRTDDITDEQREKIAMHLSAPFSTEECDLLESEAR